jgi:nucleoid DNA-binding protein
MKYKELIEQVASKYKLENPKAKKIVNTVLQNVLEGGLSSEGFKSPILKVSSKDIPARTKQDPDTGEVLELPATKRLTIKAVEKKLASK